MESIKAMSNSELSRRRLKVNKSQPTEPTKEPDLEVVDKKDTKALPASDQEMDAEERDDDFIPEEGEEEDLDEDELAD